MVMKLNALTLTKLLQSLTSLEDLLFLQKHVNMKLMNCKSDKILQAISLTKTKNFKPYEMFVPMFEDGYDFIYAVEQVFEALEIEVDYTLVEDIAYKLAHDEDYILNGQLAFHIINLNNLNH